MFKRGKSEENVGKERDCIQACHKERKPRKGDFKPVYAKKYYKECEGGKSRKKHHTFRACAVNSLIDFIENELPTKKYSAKRK